jgi:sec-independent protein translocase protein TatA
MFGLGTPELIVILLIAFLIFGSKKLPEIGAGLGKAIGSFKKGLDDIQDAGVDVKKTLPGVKEVTAVKEGIDKVKDISGILGK